MSASSLSGLSGARSDLHFEAGPAAAARQPLKAMTTVTPTARGEAGRKKREVGRRLK